MITIPPGSKSITFYLTPTQVSGIREISVTSPGLKLLVSPFTYTVTETFIESTLTSTELAVPLTSFGTLTGFSLSLPSSGTYVLQGSLRSGFFANTSTNTTINSSVYIVAQLYDITKNSAIPNTRTLIMTGTLPDSVIGWQEQQTATIGPVSYTITGATTIEVQAFYMKPVNVTATKVCIFGDANGYSTMSALKIA